jgi:hypothetical protein
MKQVLFFFVISVLLVNCKSKKKSLNDDDVVVVSDFIEFFPEAPLPIRVADTTLTRRTTDSSLIGYKIFTQFIPDSVLTKDFGKSVKPKLYPIGRTQEKGKEKYLFVKAIAGSKRVAYLACFSKDDKFLNAMPILKTGFDKTSGAEAVLDKKFQLTTYREWKGAQLRYKRNVYIFNNGSNSFILVMTEPNEEIIEQIINPIDTLARKNKLSADYVKDKRNFISIRDGKNAEEILFFVHFERDNGTCNGELKGTARLISKNTAQYQAPGNPCALEFVFAGSSVTMREVGGCGSYRDIKCFFEGSYPRKAVPKPKTSNKKK